MTLRPLFALGVLLFGVACGEDDPTGITAGERMTVEEQVAIGSALEKAARALDSTRRPADELLANWIRIGSGLVSRQGQQGPVAVRVRAEGGSDATLDMRAIVLRVDQGPARIHLVLAWDGLDVVQLRAQHVLVLLFTGTTEEGELPSVGGTADGRWIDFTTGAPFPDPFVATFAEASVSQSQFGGGCPGIPDAEDFACTTGRYAIVTDAGFERSTERLHVDWEAVVLPAFRIVGSVFDP
jgi:hypothetical protein